MADINKQVALGMLAGLSGASRPAAAQDDMDSPGPVTAELAARYALFAMAASNAYHQPPPRKWHFPLAALGWRSVWPNGTPIPLDARGLPVSASSGPEDPTLAYTIFHNDDRETIFAFRGTDNNLDYLTANIAVPWSGQYARGRAAFVAYAAGNQDRRITLTGHSLGGGLALSASVRRDVALASGRPDLTGYEAVVFNASPRIFDGWGDKHVFAERVAIYQKGEVLQRVRKLWRRKFHSVVPPRNIFQAEFDYTHPVTGQNMPDSRHDAHLLAYGMLQLGAQSDPRLAELLPKVLFA